MTYDDEEEVRVEIQINLTLDDTFIDNLFDTVWHHAHAEGSLTAQWADLFRIKGHPVFIVKPHKGDEVDAVTTTELVTALVDIAFGDSHLSTRYMRILKTEVLDDLDNIDADILIRFIVEGRITEAD